MENLTLKVVIHVVGLKDQQYYYERKYIISLVFASVLELLLLTF